MSSKFDLGLENLTVIDIKAIWLALKILGPPEFPLQPCWDGTPSISQKGTKSPPIIPHPLPPPPTHQIFTFSPWKPYSTLLLLEVGD